jgi:hypothetical protein
MALARSRAVLLSGGGALMAFATSASAALPRLPFNDVEIYGIVLSPIEIALIAIAAIVVVALMAGAIARKMQKNVSPSSSDMRWWKHPQM